MRNSPRCPQNRPQRLLLPGSKAAHPVALRRTKPAARRRDAEALCNRQDEGTRCVRSLHPDWGWGGQRTGGHSNRGPRPTKRGTQGPHILCRRPRDTRLRVRTVGED